MLTANNLFVAQTSLRVSFTFLLTRRLGVVVVIFLMCGMVAMGQGRKYGLFVGINEYPRPDERLAGAVNDAKNLHEKMKDFGFEESNTTLLTDAAATRQAIIDNIRSYQQKAKAGDLFLFTYSGHGTLFPDTSSAEIDEPDKVEMDVLLPGEHYVIPLDYYDSAIVPVDADDNKGGRAWKNLILDDELYDLFSALKQKQVRVVFISDSCNSGTIGKAEVDAENSATWHVKFLSPLQALNVKSFEELKAVKPKKQKKVGPRTSSGAYLTLSASKDNEFSWDIGGGTQDAGGLFTKTLLTVVNSGAGPLTYTQLMARVRPEVVRLSRKQWSEQTPQLDARFGNPDVPIFSFQPANNRRRTNKKAS